MAGMVAHRRRPRQPPEPRSIRPRPQRGRRSAQRTQKRTVSRTVPSRYPGVRFNDFSSAKRTL